MYTIKQYRRNKILIDSAKYLLAVVLIIFAVLPFVWIVLTSFNAAKSLMGASLIPKQLTLGNYTDLLGSKTLNYSQWFVNSLKVSSISVLCIMFLTSISAYALSRFKFRTKKYVMMSIMIFGRYIK